MLCNEAADGLCKLVQGRLSSFADLRQVRMGWQERANVPVVGKSSALRTHDLSLVLIWNLALIDKTKS